LDALLDSFALEGISGGNSVFDIDKLDWMNGQYIAQLPPDALETVLRPLFAASDVATAPLLSDASAYRVLVELLRPRAKRLTDFVDQARPLLADTVEYESAAIEKHVSSADIVSHLEALADALRTTNPFDAVHVEGAVRGTAERRSIKAGPLIHATRVALTGRTTSPGLFELITLLGREVSVARIERLVAHVRPQE